MSPDHSSIAIRERSFAELYDLALLVVRRRPWPPLLLAVGGAAPWCALDAWLLLGVGGEVPVLLWYPLLLLVAVQAPFAFAPLTAWLGAAMFDERASLGAALRDGLRPWRGLLAGGVVRGLLASTVVLLPLWSPHLPEVLVLERQGLGASWRRAAALRSANGGAGVLHLFAAAVVGGAALWLLAGTWTALGGVLLHADPWIAEDWHAYLPGHSVLPHVAIWLAVGWLTVVRFLWYIDLRTRAEGWAVDLELRAAARRLEARS
jgi:hypothetical protein